MNSILRRSGVLLVLFIPLVAPACALDTWHIQPSPTTNQLKGVTWGNGLFVAVGRLHTILTSPTGSDWSLTSTGTFDYHSVTSGNGWFVAGGREGNLVSASRDGINWIDTVSTIGTDNMFGFAFGNGLFVGVGFAFCGGPSFNCGFVLTGDDPLAFNLLNGISPVTNVLLAVAYANNLFVAVGEHGTIITSPDGVTWTPRNSGTQVSLRAVAFHQSRFIAAGDNGIVLASSNGLSWSAAAPASFHVHGLASGPDGLVAVGQSWNTGRLHVSPDGLVWPGTSLEFDYPLNAIAYGAGSFVAVGDNGLIVQSGDPANAWTKSTSGYWEESFWSLGQLPSHSQAAILFTNFGWKALGISSITTASFSNALSIKRLIVSAPNNSSNLLLLNFAGLSVPLTVDFDLTLGPNASLLSYYSALNVGTLSVSGHATFSEQSQAAIGNLVIGDTRPGGLDITNATLRSGTVLVGGESPGTINQWGGTNQVDGQLAINGLSSYLLHGGTLVASNIFLGPDGQLQLEQGKVQNPGAFTMDNGALIALGQHHCLGQLRLLSNGISSFPDRPAVSTLDLQNAATIIRFLDSHDLSIEWNGKLYVQNWSGSTNGGGASQFYVGANTQGLSAAQLRRIIFINPNGLPVANYPARILPAGEIVPGERPVLNFASAGHSLVSSWAGDSQLLSASNVMGPYTPVSGAASPYTNNSFADPQRFFRLIMP